MQASAERRQALATESATTCHSPLAHNAFQGSQFSPPSNATNRTHAIYLADIKGQTHDMASCRGAASSFLMRGFHVRSCIRRSPPRAPFTRSATAHKAYDSVRIAACGPAALPKAPAIRLTAAVLVGTSSAVACITTPSCTVDHTARNGFRLWGSLV